MTLRQAFTQWAAIPENTALAASCRSAVNAVLLKRYGDDDVIHFSAPVFVRALMQDCTEAQDVKTKAASILVHVLNFAADRGECLMPDFDYTIARMTCNDKSPKEPVPTKESRSKVLANETVSEVVAEEASGDLSPEPPSGRDEFGQFTKGMKPWNAGGVDYFGGGRKPVPVCQLHPETLEVVGRFVNMAAAHRETGAWDLYRAIRDRKMSGGFFWCRQGEEEDFTPGYKKGPKTRTWSRRKKAKGKPAKSAGKRKKVSPAEGPENIGRGKPDGGKPAVVEERRSLMPESDSPAPRNQAPLSVFSDAELRAELERRGWYGTLYQRLEFVVDRHKTENI